MSGTGANLGFIPIGSGGNESLGDITSNSTGFMYAIGRGLTGTDIDPLVQRQP
ncbi:MAG: hypothetical protein IPK03_01175 [Bacteroidetes bacterium]|nr:hypothetical protein [Bacteroidota bacterium]